ncbi:MAG: hypothetical protein J7L61_02795, partial [Thermoplasmata archaeon]|nr:hypothetical protein [Thermoplasmata archaeon]
MGKKDEEIQALRTEVETLKARIKNLEEENKQLRLRAKGLEKKLKKCEANAESILEEKTKEINDLKERVITLGKQAEKVLESKNREIERLSAMVKERTFAIKSVKPLTLMDETVVHGAIFCEGEIEVGNNVLVDGFLSSSSSIKIGNQTSIKGNVKAGGEVVVGDESEINGDIEAGGVVRVGRNSKMEVVSTKESVEIGEKSMAERIEAGGDVSISPGARVEDGIRHGGSVSIGKHAVVKGAIEYVEEEAEEEEDMVDEGPENIAPLVCPICGSKIPPHSKKCPGCGTPIRDIDVEKILEEEEDFLPEEEEKPLPPPVRKN